MLIFLGNFLQCIWEVFWEVFVQFVTVHPGVGHPRGVFGIFTYYQLVMLFLNVVCLTVASHFAILTLGHKNTH
jgi:hypothetical protein